MAESLGSECDVAVIGSSFSGTLLATILAKQGLSVIVVDRDSHPRFAVGESSTPTADFILQRLVQRYGIDELRPLVRFGTWQEQKPKIRCGCKQGFSYFWHGHGSDFHATPNHQCELLVAASSSRALADTHWYRSDVDAYFADVARRHGATILEKTKIESVDRLDRSRWRLRTQSLEIAQHSGTIRAGFLVDATGAEGFLLKEFGVADATSQLRTDTSAIFSHFDNVPPLGDWLEGRGVHVKEHPFAATDSAVHHLFHDGWMWQLEFENGPTSLGFVFARRADADAGQRATWQALLSDRPVFTSIFGNPQLASTPGRVVTTERLQRLFAAAAGDGWAALPSTVGFVDPLHSTGIAHSLSGVERLSEVLLLKPEQRAKRLEEYSNAVIDEIRFIDRLIWGCYVGLCDFRLFASWSMIYFAVATNSERWRSTAPESTSGFLGADRSDFTDNRLRFER